MVQAPTLQHVTASMLPAAAIEASQAEAGPVRAHPAQRCALQLEPPAAAPNEKMKLPCEDPNFCALDYSIWKRF